MKINHFFSELIEENEENEELSEVEGINHFRTGEKPLSCSQTQKDLTKKKKSQEIFHLHSVWKEIDKQTES